MRPLVRPPWLRQTSLLPWLPRAAPQHVPPRRIATTSSRNAAPVDIPKLIISPGSAHHNSLSSFLDYAKRTNLTPDKTVYIGTHYEYTTALALMRLGFSLLRVGRKSDAGIDLIGHWVLAPLREPLPVIIQCKSRKVSLTPSRIREMEGSFQGIPADWRKKDVLGLLITTKKATDGMRKALGKSKLPLGFVMISREGTIQQFLWNPAASERGLEGVGVTVRHTPRALMTEAEKKEVDQDASTKKSLAKFRNTETKKDIQLTWMGSPIFPDRNQLDPETVKLMRAIDPAESIVKKRGRPKASDENLSPTDSKSTPARAMARTDKRFTVVRTPGKPGRPTGSRLLAIDKAPSPRGGEVGGRPRGRPKGSKNKPKVPDTG